MRRAAAAVAVLASLLGAGGCSPVEGGPLAAAFDGEPPSVISCMPLGPGLEKTGQVAVLALDVGSLATPVTVEGLTVTGAPNGVEVRVIGLVEPNADGEYAPMSSFFDGEPARADALESWEILDPPGEVSTTGGGVLFAAIVTVGPDAPAEAFTAKLESLSYRAGGTDYVFPLDHQLDVVPYEPFQVPDEVRCGEEVEEEAA